MYDTKHRETSFPKNLYRSSDMNFSSFLLMNEVDFIGIEKSEAMDDGKQRCNFVFDIDTESEKLVQLVFVWYNNDSVSAPLKRILNASKTLKKSLSQFLKNLNDAPEYDPDFNGV